MFFEDSQVYAKYIFFQSRFDQIFEPGTEPMSDKAELMNKKVPLEMLIKAQDEPKISKEEENTVVLQVCHTYNIKAEFSLPIYAYIFCNAYLKFHNGFSNNAQNYCVNRKWQQALKSGFQSFNQAVLKLRVAKFQNGVAEL